MPNVLEKKLLPINALKLMPENRLCRLKALKQI